MTRKARSYAEDWLLMGIRMQKLMKYEKAESSFKKAVDADPTFSEAWKMYGEILLELKRYDEAELAFSKAIELDSRYETEGLSQKSEIAKIKNMTLALDNLRSGIRFLGTSQIHSAIDHFEKGIKFDPELGLSWKLLGDAHFLGGSLRSARDAHRKARVLDPELMSEIINLLDEGDTQGLFEHDYTEVLLLLVSEAASKISKERGTLKIHSETVLKQVETLKKQLEDNSSDIDKWRQLASLLDLIDQHAEAALTFSRALELDMTDIRTQTLLVVSLHKQARRILLSSMSEVVPVKQRTITIKNPHLVVALLKLLFQILKSKKQPDYYI